LVRWSHASGKDAITKGGSVTEPTAVVPSRSDHRACAPRARVIEIKEK
jgi:hypothetical protein